MFSKQTAMGLLGLSKLSNGIGIVGIKPLVAVQSVMPSDSDAILWSLRRWLLVTVFVLGLAVIALADIAYTVSNYSNGPIPAVIGATGGVVALIAGLKALGTLSTAQ